MEQARKLFYKHVKRLAILVVACAVMLVVSVPVAFASATPNPNWTSAPPETIRPAVMSQQGIADAVFANFGALFPKYFFYWKYSATGASVAFLILAENIWYDYIEPSGLRSAYYTMRFEGALAYNIADNNLELRRLHNYSNKYNALLDGSVDGSIFTNGINNDIDSSNLAGTAYMDGQNRWYYYDMEYQRLKGQSANDMIAGLDDILAILEEMRDGDSETNEAAGGLDDAKSEVAFAIQDIGGQMDGAGDNMNAALDAVDFEGGISNVMESTGFVRDLLSAIMYAWGSDYNTVFLLPLLLGLIFVIFRFPFSRLRGHGSGGD